MKNEQEEFNPIISVKTDVDNLMTERNKNSFPVIDFDKSTKELKINPLNETFIKITELETVNKTLSSKFNFPKIWQDNSFSSIFYSSL
jgi:hypothetical protein